MVIDENFRIEADAFSWNLVREVNKGLNEKTGKDTISTDLWYCTSIKDCLRRYANEAPKQSKNYEELLSKLETIEQIIREISVMNKNRDER